MGEEQKWAAAAQAMLDAALVPGEEPLAAAAGTDPRSVTADKAVGAAESVVRGLGSSQANARRRAQEGAGSGARLFAVTTQRIFLFDRGQLTSSIELAAVTGVETKRALSNAYRTVLTVRTADGQVVAIEGDKAQVEALARAVAARSPGGGAALKAESSTWLLRMAPVVVLIFLGVMFLLMGIGVTLDTGIGTGIIPVGIGAALLGGGLYLRKLLLK
jgi:hypothetical protein